MANIVTGWAFPLNVYQSAEVPEHVQWDESGFVYLRYEDDSSCRTLLPLDHIPNSFAGDRNKKTWYLHFSNLKFNYIPDDITGIEVRLGMQRGGRITDETIQLTKNSELIGTNWADQDLNPIKTYGAIGRTWGLESLTQEEKVSLLTSMSFGITIRFRSHPNYPCRETARVNYIKIRLIKFDEEYSNKLADFLKLPRLTKDSSGDSLIDLEIAGGRAGGGWQKGEPGEGDGGSVIDDTRVNTPPASPPAGTGTGSSTGNPNPGDTDPGYQNSTGYVGSGYLGSAGSGYQSSTGYNGSGTDVQVVATVNTPADLVGVSGQSGNYAIVLTPYSLYFWNGTGWQFVTNLI